MLAQLSETVKTGIFRFCLGIFLLRLGLVKLDGLQGDMLGIVVALVELLPFTMSVTASCFVFRWFHIHSFSKKELEIHGTPYQK